MLLQPNQDQLGIRFNVQNKISCLEVYTLTILSLCKAEMVHDFIWIPATTILVMGTIAVGVMGQIILMGFAHTAQCFRMHL